MYSASEITSKATWVDSVTLKRRMDITENVHDRKVLEAMASLVKNHTRYPKFAMLGGFFHIADSHQETL